MRRGLPLAVVLCLLGAVLLLVAGGRSWATLVVPAAPPLPDTVLRLRGDDLVPGLQALALVGLAGVAALPASRGVLRPVVGVLLAVAGGVAAVLVARVLAAPTAAVARAGAVREAHAAAGGADLSTAPVAGLVGGVLLLAAGGYVVLRGRTWGTLGARYEAPAQRAAQPAAEAPPESASDKAVWDALDRGEDPTR